MTRSELIAAIERCARDHAISPATVTSRAVANSRLYARLIGGGDCTTSVAERLASYIQKQNCKAAAAARGACAVSGIAVKDRAGR